MSVTAVVAVLLVLTSPGFVLSWFRLYWGERVVSTMIVVFLFGRLLASAGDSTGTILSVLAAAVAMLYKEPAFLAFAVYSALSLGHDTGALVVIDRLTLAAAAVYVGVYIGWILPYKQATYSASHYRWPLVAAKNLVNYALFSDPVVMLIALPLAVVHPAPGLVAAVAYVVPFLATNVYNPYYLLPALVWAMPDLARAYSIGTFAGPGWSGILGVAAMAFAGNALPASLHYLTFFKYMPLNFSRTVDWLVAWISRQPRQVRVFLDGVDRSRHMTNFLIWHEFLTYRGLPAHRFDMESAEAPKHPPGPVSLTEDQLACCGAYSGGEPPEIQTGDLLIVAPDSNRNVTIDYVGRLFEDGYDVLFRTQSRFAVPYRTFKTLVKWLLRNRWSDLERRRFGWIVSGNTDEWPDYYVLRRR